MTKITDVIHVVKYNPTKCDVITKVRLCMLVSALVHLVMVTVYMLSIDFSESGDPKVQFYQEVRFKLITCWFNLVNLVYLPTSIYCEWRRINSQDDRRHVKILNKFRFICFTSILFPTTAFADTLFWRLWNKDREFIAPAAVDTLAPFWTQHCMHTVSLVVAVMDLILTPRKKPKDCTLGLSVMFLFVGAYVSVCLHAITQGQYIYPVFKLLSVPKLCFLVLYVFLEHYFYYTLQWCVVDIIWGTGRNVKNRNISKYFVPVSRELSLNKVLPILRLTKSAVNIQS